MLLANDIGNRIEVLVKADVNQRLAGVGRNGTFYTAVKSVVKIMGIACFVGRRLPRRGGFYSRIQTGDRDS